MTEKPVLSIIIVTWDNLRYTRECIESVLRNRPNFPWEMILVDNGSKDGSVPYLQSLATGDPAHFKVILNDKNQGFPRAVNQGMLIAQGHPFLLNNDAVIVQEGTFEMLLDTLMSNPALGAVGPTSNFVLGPQSVQLSLAHPQAVHPARMLIGFCELIRREAAATTGGMDEDNFSPAGSDDLDYSIRLRNIGWKLAINRNVFVYHHGARSVNRLGGYQAIEGKGKATLVHKWGQKVADELFLPVNLTGCRVLLCVPTWGEVPAEAFGNHLLFVCEHLMAARFSGLEIHPHIYPRSAITRLRCHAADTAIQREFDYLLFVDDDAIIQCNDALRRMIDRKLPVVAGEFYLRTPPHYIAGFMDYGDRNGEVRYIARLQEEELAQVDAVGMHFTLISVDALKRVKKIAGARPLFAEGPVTPGTRGVGEDIFFSKLCAEAGIPIFIDRAVPIGHLGQRIVIDRAFHQQQHMVARQQGGMLPGEDISRGYPSHRIGFPPDGTDLAPEGSPMSQPGQPELQPLYGAAPGA